MAICQFIALQAVFVEMPRYPERCDEVNHFNVPFVRFLRWTAFFIQFSRNPNQRAFSSSGSQPCNKESNSWIKAYASNNHAFETTLQAANLSFFDLLQLSLNKYDSMFFNTLIISALFAFNIHSTLKETDRCFCFLCGRLLFINQQRLSHKNSIVRWGQTVLTQGLCFNETSVHRCWSITIFVENTFWSVLLKENGDTVSRVRHSPFAAPHLLKTF